MRLYSLIGVNSLNHEQHGLFEPEDDGGFEVPHELGLLLKNTHIDGKKAWEDDGERSLRLAMEEESRRRDPATLLAAVERLASQQAQVQEPDQGKDPGSDEVVKSEEGEGEPEPEQEESEGEEPEESEGEEESEQEPTPPQRSNKRSGNRR